MTPIRCFFSLLLPRDSVPPRVLSHVLEANSDTLRNVIVRCHSQSSPHVSFLSQTGFSRVHCQACNEATCCCPADGRKARAGASPSSKLLAFTDLFIPKPKIIHIANLFQSRYFCFGVVCVIISFVRQTFTFGLPMKDLIENLALHHSNYCF